MARGAKLGAAWLGCALALLSASSGCSRSSQEQKEKRRAVLTAVPLQDKQREVYEKLRLYDDAGKLLASDVKVAGMVMPRGMTQTFAFDREWYFDGKPSTAKLEEYFRAHLEVSQESHPGNDTLELYLAKPKDTPNALPVLVRIYPQPGRGDSNRVYIRQAAPPRDHYPSEDEVRAQIVARQKHAD